jgi:hypothetical protein
LFRRAGQPCKEDFGSRCPERFVPGQQAAGSAGVGLIMSKDLGLTSSR